MSFVDQPWQPNLRWEAPAGQLLQKLVAALPRDRHFSITVFGSAPLQLGIEPSFQSADVDIFSSDDLRIWIEAAGLGEGQSAFYIQQSPEFVFSASPSWRERAFVVVKENVTFAFPHPIDILVSKLKRLEPKDLNAFALVLERTGHPTANELKMALQRHIDLFRPNFDEENSGDAVVNTQVLWRALYKKNIDVRREIIAPALQERRVAYGEELPSLKQELPDE
jgi:hypothetical protein